MFDSRSVIQSTAREKRGTGSRILFVHICICMFVIGFCLLFVGCLMHAATSRFPFQEMVDRIWTLKVVTAWIRFHWLGNFTWSNETGCRIYTLYRDWLAFKFTRDLPGRNSIQSDTFLLTPWRSYSNVVWFWCLFPARGSLYYFLIIEENRPLWLLNVQEEILWLAASGVRSSSDCASERRMRVK
jgi:hypothetical protein